MAVFCSVLPDLDVVGFSLGVSYGDFFGHRGFSHSLFFAFLLSLTVVLLAFRNPPIFSKKWWLIWLFFFGVTSSHCILDAFTSGGMGVAILSPFDIARYYSPWQPLSASPIGIQAFFTARGTRILLSELYWIWLPLLVPFIIEKSYRKIKHTNCNENTTVKLHQNISERILLGLFAFLLVAAIIIQSPWKITTLLVILIIVCTMLPKYIGKWSRLIVLIISTLLAISVFNQERFAFETFSKRPEDFPGFLMQPEYAVDTAYTKTSSRNIYSMVYSVPDSIEPKQLNKFLKELHSQHGFTYLKHDLADPNVLSSESWEEETFESNGESHRYRYYVMHWLRVRPNLCRLSVLVKSPWKDNTFLAPIVYHNTIKKNISNDVLNYPFLHPEEFDPNDLEMLKAKQEQGGGER